MDNGKVKDDKSVGWYKIITRTNHIIKISEENLYTKIKIVWMNILIVIDISQCTQEQL